MRHNQSQRKTPQNNKTDPQAPFSATLEDIYGAQAQYYDLPYLSFRTAMWRLTELHK